VREHATAISEQPSDLALWEYARRNNLVIVTKDADFFDLLAMRGSPPRVVWVRTGNLRRIDLERLMEARWSDIRTMLDSADLVVVHPDRLEALRF
jgi:predicted nuclease of predicted toxin-antitoxin system